jgi:hypothetical protein
MRMTDKLKKWLENGVNAEISAELIGESMNANYWLKTKNAQIMLHPQLGTFAVTKYGAIFFVPRNIERIAELGDELYIYTRNNFVFVYDMETGEMKDMTKE